MQAFVPAGQRTTDYPCYSISVGDHGETLGTLVATAYPPRTEALLETWLRNRIAELAPVPIAGNASLALGQSGRERPRQKVAMPPRDPARASDCRTA